MLRLQFFILIIFSTSCKAGSGNTEQRLQHFYKYYFTEKGKSLDAEVSADTLHKYFTVSFIKDITRMQQECDPITQTQDHDGEWAKTLVATQFRTTDTFNICFIADKKHCFKVVLREENRAMKIYKVLYP